MNDARTIDARAAQVLDPLREDHEKVKQLFEEFESATGTEQKQRIVEHSIQALEEHSYVEEKVLYPAFESALEQKQLIDEALEEHHVVHLLIAELKKMTAGDDRFDAKFTVLAESVKHHIEEEEGEIFPQVEEADLDWASIAKKAVEARQHFVTKVGRVGKPGGKVKKVKPTS